MVGDVNARDSEREMRAVSDKLRRAKCMKALFPVFFFFLFLTAQVSTAAATTHHFFFCFFFF